MSMSQGSEGVCNYKSADSRYSVTSIFGSLWLQRWSLHVDVSTWNIRSQILLCHLQWLIAPAGVHDNSASEAMNQGKTIIQI